MYVWGIEDMSENIKIKVKRGDTVKFNNNAMHCIGTGRLYLALRREYHNQLKKVQEEIGFKYIRGHGLFCDDVGIFQRYEEDGELKTEYNFRYIDMIFDDYLSLGLKPFVELGFMPKELASGDQTIFYWEGNVTPPSDYDEWAALVKATINHWISRYGLDEVLTWPMEVWNEPNLESFWKDADMEEYFKLYDVTSRAVKSCDPGIRVGGPAICGVDDERWLRCFLEYCSGKNVPLDFVTRHSYSTAPADYIPHYAYQKLYPAEYIPDELAVSREIIDSFPAYKGMEMHITEFNTSYSPRNPIHDINLNAAYTARLLSVMGDTCTSYAYWTFGDVFEEQGIAFTPFSGCFGLLANGMIPKPTYWTFHFYSKLGTNAVARGDNYVVTKGDNEVLQGLTWFPYEELEGDETLSLQFSFELDNGEYLLVKKLVDEVTSNPLKSWIDMGSPAYPSEKQLKLLRECALPLTTTERKSITNGQLELDLSLSANAVCYFEITRIEPETDRGFIAERIRGIHTF
jgi:xylan 1,4-beta-xylosidase